MKLIHYEMTLYVFLFVYLLYANIKWAVYFSAFMVGMSLISFFCTSQGMDLEIETIKGNEVIYKEYIGDYQKMYEKLNEFHKAKRLFNLNEFYFPFGIFYDNPEKFENKNKCRAVYGIIIEKTVIKCMKHNEMLEYFKKDGFKTGNLPSAECVKGIYSSWFSIQNSFIYLASIMIKIVNYKFFSRLFTPKWKVNKIKIARKNYTKKHGVIEIYKPYEIQFYVPVENEKEFML